MQVQLTKIFVIVGNLLNTFGKCLVVSLFNEVITKNTSFFIHIPLNESGRFFTNRTCSRQA